MLTVVLSDESVSTFSLFSLIYLFKSESQKDFARFTDGHSLTHLPVAVTIRPSAWLPHVPTLLGISAQMHCVWVYLRAALNRIIATTAWSVAACAATAASAMMVFYGSLGTERTYAVGASSRAQAHVDALVLSFLASVLLPPCARQRRKMKRHMRSCHIPSRSHRLSSYSLSLPLISRSGGEVCCQGRHVTSFASLLSSCGRC